MAIKLTAELAEFIGFWKLRRTLKGVGIEGNVDAQERFVQYALSLRLAPANKIVSDEKAIWFSNLKVKNFFEETVKHQGEIFDRPNRISAAYIRGMYISKGEASTIDNVKFKDQLLIERMGFYTKLSGRMLHIRNIEKFKSFIEGKKIEKQDK